MIISLDASTHAVERAPRGATALDAAAVHRELERARRAGARVCAPAPNRLPPFDLKAYCTSGVSFHRDKFGAGPLVVSLALADVEGAGPFCPLENAHAGGFCNNATPSYDPADFDRLVEFARRRLRRALPEIRRHVADHLRAKRDFLSRTSPEHRAPPEHRPEHVFADDAFDVMSVE